MLCKNDNVKSCWFASIVFLVLNRVWVWVRGWVKANHDASRPWLRSSLGSFDVQWNIFSCYSLFRIILGTQADLSDTSKILKGFLTMSLSIQVMAFTVNFWKFFRYSTKNQMTEFWPEIFPIDRSNHPYYILKISTKTNVPLSRYWIFTWTSLLRLSVMVYGGSLVVHLPAGQLLSRHLSVWGCSR